MRKFWLLLVSSLLAVSTLVAQPLQKSATGLDPGNTKATGAQFTYRLTYNCSSTSGPCLNSEVDDLLPASVAFISTVPASPTGDVAAINVTGNFGGSGRTRVQFVMVTPLTAGNSGDLLINVKFPNGSTPDGTVATNTADGINLGASPGTFTTPPVNVTATASQQASVSKTLTSAPANLDLPESYRLRISNSGSNGTLNLTAIGPITDTLPPGTVFNSATPAADCQPGCVGTTPATVTWTSPCSLPLTPGNNCDITLNVTFPSATFTSGTNVTNSFTGTATALGKPPAALGVGTTTHSVTTFVPAPSASLSKNVAGGSPNPPTLNQSFSYDFVPSNNGNVPLDTMVVIDTLPIQMHVTSVTTGAYNNLSDFSAGVGVRVSYEKNTALGVFTLWGSSPNATTNTTLTAPPPGLGAGEYITRIKWEYGQAAVGMSPSTRPNITGTITNPDNAGTPVAFGATISNCVALTAVYTAGPTPVSQNTCRNFTLSGPFVQLNPAKDNLSGGGPFNPGQAVSFRLHVRSASQSSDPAPLQFIVAADLLPVDLVFTSWTFDDQSTGLPAPQNFTQTPNYAGSGRTLLRWNWNAGSGNLAVGQEVWILINTTIRVGAQFGSLTNTFDLTSNNPGLAQRCSGSSATDALDLDGDSSTADTLCTASGTATIAPIAQLASSKTIKGTCDGGAVALSAGTLVGGAIEYHLTVNNPGTVPMQNFVLIDILPFVGDTGVRDTNPRGSQWTPLLAAPITPPPGTTIYYTTAGNPCRGEVGGPTTGCTPPNWTTVAPNPITSVRAFKIEFGSKVLGPADVLNFSYSMIAPGSTPPGQTAYNSFAYQADRSDGLGSLAAEPQKVGIALGACPAAALGDFVWVDTNHDGTQNDGPTGLNNVYVQLFSPGVDGIQGTADDVPLASTITSNNPVGGAPGWYFFPGLAPGSYYVKVTPPPTFTFTLQNVGSGATNSDANPATGASQVVTLVANQTNPDIDFGLFTAHTAALGNYVWFDRNGNGLQDEPVTAGVNGVTVRLFVDNGDNTPGAGDVQVATTVTADDVYGRPGYYLFDQLTPGLSYYVQFVAPSAATGFTSLHTGGDSTVDSDANTSTGNSQLVTLAPDEVNLTIDAGLLTSSGTLALGDQVWRDTNNNGIFEPQSGETGIDNVRLDLYRDVNNDGLPSLDEYLDTTTTGTVSGFAGRYRFNNLAPGNYIVVVHSASFDGGGALFGLSTSTGNDPAPDPDDDVNGDDNGTNLGALIGSKPVTLSNGGEPTSEDGDPNTNLTVDFGFITSSPTPLFYDYGDAPDNGSGTSRGNYNTTALDNGPFHLLGVANAPYLGTCVDGDNGFLQNGTATADDTGPHSLVVGTCAGTSDENGVTFTGPFTPGGTATFNVTAGGGPTQCHLDAWVDWNQDGIFGNSAGEQVATNLVVPLGPPTVLSPSVPAAAIPGTTYARFRCSSTGNLPPTGSAADGEVEDYAVPIIGYDYGDAPNSYLTSGAGAARHVITPGTSLTLGQCVDTELDGQPTVNADGDDVNAGTSRIGTCADDEDGIVFTSPIATCNIASVTVTAGAAGKLDAWIDFNRDGDFNDAGEQIFVGQTVAAGANLLTFPVPCNASGGTSYMRFRLSSAGGLGPAGDAPDGEVEDYAVVIRTVDFSDAPNSYGTTFASNGARHVIVTGFSLGATIDSETDGQPNASATGDGADEDGVSFTSGSLFKACTTQSITVTLTNTAAIGTPRLDAWIDFDGDGVFDTPRDHVVSSLALVAGANIVNVNVPCDAKTRTTYARFRLSSTGTALPTGQAMDGEVEDYLVTTAGLDFGDAPDPSYPTRLSSNGARHYVLPSNNPTLGPTVTTEPDGQPNATATGDSDDGVSFPAPLIPGTTGSIRLTAGATGGIASCWMDFNHNGSWADAGEQIVTNAPLSGGASQTFTFPIPVPAVSGPTMTRCRISTLSGLTPAGLAPDGEVEDWAATMLVATPKIGVGECLISTTVNDPVATDIALDVLVTNMGNVPLTSVALHTPMASTITAPATYTVLSVTSSNLTVNPGYNGNSNDNLLAAGVILAPAQSGVVHLVIRVDPHGTIATYQSSSTGNGTAPDLSVVSDVSQDGCNVDPDADGNPGNNSVPTPFLVVTLVPALSVWVLMFLGLALALIATRKV